MEDLFGPLYSDEENETPQDGVVQYSTGFKEEFIIRDVVLMEGEPAVKITEFNFHPLNANLAWPGEISKLFSCIPFLTNSGNGKFATFIVENWTTFSNKRIFELGSATGILSIFLYRKYNCNVSLLTYRSLSNSSRSLLQIIPTHKFNLS
jgi:hypothetical protein